MPKVAGGQFVGVGSRNGGRGSRRRGGEDVGAEENRQADERRRNGGSGAWCRERRERGSGGGVDGGRQRSSSLRRSSVFMRAEPSSRRLCEQRGVGGKQVCRRRRGTRYGLCGEDGCADSSDRLAGYGRVRRTCKSREHGGGGLRTPQKIDFSFFLISFFFFDLSIFFQFFFDFF